jgi:D-amino-acid oxidase
MLRVGYCIAFGGGRESKRAHLSKTAVLVNKRITVIGAGVIGLTTAIELQRRLKRPVTIIAKALPPQTTSNIAAAIWLPFHVAPEDKAIRWSRVTRQVLESQMPDPDSGVFETELFELTREAEEDPYWVAAVSGYRYAARDELPPGFGHGIVARVPMIDTPVYMPWLVGRFLDGGGTLQTGSVDRLTDLTEPDAIIVNCTGLGARELCRDEAMYPLRGQIMRLPVAGFPRALTDQQTGDSVAYLLPRRNELIAGGTVIKNDWSTEPRPETAAGILERVARLDPSLGDVRVTEHLVGLRPGRPEVRLEREQFGVNAWVIHNYGHGGAGFTLGWGCAADVADMVESLEDGADSSSFESPPGE